MTLKRAESRIGTKLITHDNQPLNANCDYVAPSRGHEGISLMVERGLITHILATSPGVTTRSGVRVGDSTSKLKRLFGEQLEVESHQYDDSGSCYFVWERDRRHGVKFEIGGDKGDCHIRWRRDNHASRGLFLSMWPDPSIEATSRLMANVRGSECESI